MDTLIENIHTAGIKFLEPLTPEETYSTIVHEAMRLVDARYGSVFLERGGVLERIYASSPKLYDIKVRRDGYTYKAFKIGEPAIVDIARTKKIHPHLSELKVKSTIYIPLAYRNKVIGVLSLDSVSNEKFSTEELRALKVFGSFASLAIRKTELYNEAKQSAELRDYFMSAAAHELRTPLTSISGYIQLLHSRIGQSDSMEGRWVRNLYQESNRLTHLVTELLEINRIKSGKTEYVLKEHSIIDIIKRAVNKLQYHYPSVKFEFTQSPQIKKDLVIGDYDRLLHAVYNVLENSAKFSPEHETVHIELQLKNGYFVITIKDHGEGIPQDVMQGLFDGHFNGVDDADRKGIGIGLFLVKRILEKHHGLIEIRSKLKKGTTVIIKLPMSKNK